MDNARERTQDGHMNETPRSEADSGFDPHKVRGITDVKRPTDDRMVAGVCAGIAKHLNIDPVILRVVLAALTFVGFAGVILYLAGWFLLPSEDEEKSVAAQWFKLDENEEQFRVVGLIAAGVLAITAGTGVLGGDWGQPFPWFGLIALAGIYFWIIRPAQKRREQAEPETRTVVTQTASGETVTQQLITEPKVPKTPWSPILTLVTLFSALIAMGGVALYADANESQPWTTYAVAALGVIAVGLLIGSFFGNGEPLIWIGIMVAIVLALSALLPSAKIGASHYPNNINAFDTSYTLGIGEMRINFDELADPMKLEGSTVDVEVGIGSTRIVVPEDVNVEVNADLTAGEIRVFDRKTNGTQTQLTYEADNPLGSKLILNIDQTFGDVIGRAHV